MIEVLLYLLTVYGALGSLVWFMMFLAQLKEPAMDIPIWSPMMIVMTVIIWPWIIRDQISQRL